MYTIHELTEGEYATDNEIICNVSIVNGEKRLCNSFSVNYVFSRPIV
jgi:hypothetical protein